MAARVAQSDRGRMMDEDQHAWVEQGPLDNEEFVRITRGTMLRDLRQLPEQELVRRYDVLLSGPQLPLMLEPEDYLIELQRRETVRQNKRRERLSCSGLRVQRGAISLLCAHGPGGEARQARRIGSRSA
jgi:hypothetical protein